MRNELRIVCVCGWRWHGRPSIHIHTNTHTICLAHTSHARAVLGHASVEARNAFVVVGRPVVVVVTRSLSPPPATMMMLADTMGYTHTDTHTHSQCKKSFTSRSHIIMGLSAGRCKHQMAVVFQFTSSSALNAYLSHSGAYLCLCVCVCAVTAILKRCARSFPAHFRWICAPLALFGICVHAFRVNGMRN